MAEQGRAELALVVTNGPLAGRRVEVGQEAVIGRRDVDLAIEDLQISRRHAVVRRAGPGLEIEDLGSSNGTFVNGARIGGRTPLRGGDMIRVGATELRVEAGWESMQTLAVPVGQPEAETPEPTTVQPVATSAEVPAAAAPAERFPTEPLSGAAAMPSVGRRPAWRRSLGRVITVIAVPVLALGVGLAAWFVLEGPPSKREYIEAAEDICNEARGQFEEVDVDDGANLSRLGRTLRRVGSIRSEALEELQRMVRPAEDREVLQRFFDAFGRTNDALATLVRAIEDRDGRRDAAIDRARDRLASRFREERAAARSFGFAECSRMLS